MTKVLLLSLFLLTGCTANQVDEHADRGTFARGSAGSAGGMYQIIRGDTQAQACGLGEIGEPLQGALTIKYKDESCELHYQSP